MDNDEFEKLIEEAIATIPKEFLEKLENVSIFVVDFPTRHQVMKLRVRGRGGLLLGLYEGVPQTRRRYYGVGGTLPDKITIFKLPILSIARTRDDLKEIVKNTVWHEIAHHFGMDEREVAEAERKRRERFQ